MSKRSLLSLSLLVVPAAAAAQVGHDPATSPYVDIRNRTNLVATGWRIAGSGGQVDIGPSSGEGLGLRYEMRLSGPTDAMLEVSWTRLERLVIDPNGAEAERVSGPLDQSVVFAGTGLSVLLTGDKTWNGFAPYLGAGLGVAFGGAVPSDTSGFRFKTKFFAGPHLGVRFYATRALSLRIEGRLLFWQLKYPQTFFSNPARAPAAAPVLDLETDPDAEWTSHPMLLFAVGYAVRL